MRKRRVEVPPYTSIESSLRHGSAVHPLDAVLDAQQEHYDAMHVDRLTKLPNEYAFEKTTREWREAHPDAWYCLAMVDLDDFGIINKQIGHHAGNETLILVANILKDAFHRRDEMVARLGGDEFILFLPINDLQQLLFSDESFDAQAIEESLKTYIVNSLHYAQQETLNDIEGFDHVKNMDFSVGVQLFSTTETLGVGAKELILGEGGPDARMQDDKVSHKARKVLSDHESYDYRV